MEIIVKARDEASGVLKNVGESAGGLGSKLSGLNELAETGHGIHSMLRQARNISIAFELIPVGVDAVKAAFSTLNGTAEQAAEGQRALYEGIKGIPLVGKPAAEAAEFLGSTLAHAFGKQSTAEMEADIEAKKKILTDFAETEKKLAAELNKSDNEANLVGLTPSEAEIEKAKRKYVAAIAEVNKSKADALKAGGQGKNVSSAFTEIMKVESNALKVEQFEIAKVHANEINEQAAFNSHLTEIANQRAEQVKALTDDLNTKTLESENRGYEARIASLQANTDKQVDVIRAGREKAREEYQKQVNELTVLAQAGDQAAIQKMQALAGAFIVSDSDAHFSETLAKRNGAAEQAAARQAAIRAATIANLQQEAAAGDAVAKVQLDRLNHAKELEATENALKAILNDQAATDQQKRDAYAQLVELGNAELATTQSILQANEVSILEKEAALGDDVAKNKLAQLEATKQQATAEAQLQSILANSLATDQQKLDAQKQLAELKGLQQQQANKQAGDQLQDSGLFLLQQEASLGDKVAEQQLKKLQIEKEYTEEKKKLLAILSSGADDKSKQDAKSLLSALNESEANSIKGITHDKKDDKIEEKGGLATAVQDFYLTGVNARAEQEQSQFQPVVAAQGQTTAAIQDIAKLLEGYFNNQSGGSRKELR